jgi:hypothetical protein
MAMSSSVALADGRQQDLCTLKLAYGVLTGAEKRLEFLPLGLAEFNPIA